MVVRSRRAELLGMAHPADRRCTSGCAHYGFVLCLRILRSYTLPRLSPVNVPRCRVGSISRHNNSYCSHKRPPQSLSTPHRRPYIISLPGITSPPTLDVGGAPLPPPCHSSTPTTPGTRTAAQLGSRKVLAAFDQTLHHHNLTVQTPWPMRRAAPRRGNSRSTSISL